MVASTEQRLLLSDYTPEIIYTRHLYEDTFVVSHCLLDNYLQRSHILPYWYHVVAEGHILEAVEK